MKSTFESGIINNIYNKFEPQWEERRNEWEIIFDLTDFFFNFTGDSRSRSFETMILEQTGGKGVDVVLNSLAGPLFQASMNCLGEQGRFLELGKVDFINRTLIDSYIFLKNCSFHGIMLDNLYYSDHPHRKLVVKLVQEGEFN